MATKCRISTCSWTGPTDDVFTHCETYHRAFIREHKNNGYYDFSFDDLTHEAFLLIGKNGLYWFCLELQNEMLENGEMLKRGIFHIGESEPLEYTLKMGLMRDGHVEYLGPHTSRPEDSAEEVYDLDFPFPTLEIMNEVITSRKIRIYVGTFDDSDDRYVPDCDDWTWTEEDEATNRLCIERFTCSICFEYIRRDARFCEKQHFVCLNCFDEMFKRHKLRCPICRGDYSYESHSDKIERFLRMVKFPEEDECGSEIPSTSAKRFKAN